MHVELENQEEEEEEQDGDSHLKPAKKLMTAQK
jgi:hypothetical protein